MAGFDCIQKDDQLLGMVLRQNGGSKSRGLEIEERFTKNEKWFEEYWRENISIIRLGKIVPLLKFLKKKPD